MVITRIRQGCRWSMLPPFRGGPVLQGCGDADRGRIFMLLRTKISASIVLGLLNLAVCSSFHFKSSVGVFYCWLSIFWLVTMEGLAALSVVMAGVQLADFSAKLISTSREYYKSVDCHVQVSSNWTDIADKPDGLCQCLKQSLAELHREHEICQEEKLVQEASQDCQDAALKLGDHLVKLQVTRTKRSWQSVRKALTLLCGQEELERIFRRLRRPKEIYPSIFFSCSSKLDIINPSHRNDRADQSKAIGNYCQRTKCTNASMP